MQALHKVGVSSSIGGSIAGSIQGMQQSTPDIDLVLIQQEPTVHVVVAALTALPNDYLAEPEKITRACSEGTSLSLIHIGTLTKIDLISSHTPDFK